MTIERLYIERLPLDIILEVNDEVNKIHLPTHTYSDVPPRLVPLDLLVVDSQGSAQDLQDLSMLSPNSQAQNSMGSLKATHSFRAYSGLPCVDK